MIIYDYLKTRQLPIFYLLMIEKATHDIQPSQNKAILMVSWSLL